MIGEYWGNPKTRPSAELLIDLQEDRAARGGRRRDAAGTRRGSERVAVPRQQLIR
jgi:hypothetical protein